MMEKFRLRPKVEKSAVAWLGIFRPNKIKTILAREIFIQ